MCCLGFKYLVHTIGSHLCRLQGDNTYATIQHPTRRPSSNTAPMSLADDIADYATLSGAPHNSNSSHSSLSRAPNVSNQSHTPLQLT